MRCRACDAVMTSDEMVLREETSMFEDLCKKCIKASRLGEDDDGTIDIELEIGFIKREYKWHD